MKRLAQAIFSGVLITGILLAIAISINSQTVSCVLLWQACLVDAIRGHPPEREFPLGIFIGLFLAIAIYSLVTYIILWVKSDAEVSNNETGTGCGCCGCFAVVPLIAFIALLILLLP